MKKLIILSILATVGLNFSCSDSFFEIAPQGAANLASLSNKNGVNALLVGAYSLLDGVGSGNVGRTSTSSNYVFGGITSGDGLKEPMLEISRSKPILSSSTGYQIILTF